MATLHNGVALRQAWRTVEGWSRTCLTTGRKDTTRARGRSRRESKGTEQTTSSPFSFSVDTVPCRPRATIVMGNAFLKAWRGFLHDRVIEDRLRYRYAGGLAILQSACGNGMLHRGRCYAALAWGQHAARKRRTNPQPSVVGSHAALGSWKKGPTMQQLGQQGAQGGSFMKVKKNSREPMTNKAITSEVVRLVEVGEDGSQSSKVVSLKEALMLAEKASMDLVTVSDKGDPPVVRVMDWARERYRRQKAEKEKAKKMRPHQIKRINFKGMIEKHDLERKVKTIEAYVTRGDKVKVSLTAHNRLLLRDLTCLDTLEKSLLSMLDPNIVQLEHSSTGTIMRRDMTISPVSQKNISKASARAGTPSKRPVSSTPATAPAPAPAMDMATASADAEHPKSQSNKAPTPALTDGSPPLLGVGVVGVAEDSVQVEDSHERAQTA
ncbi:unnamed protein product [Discosporangium mesarthrocarpum]